MGKILPGVAREATLPAVNRGQFWYREHEILPGVKYQGVADEQTISMATINDRGHDTPWCSGRGSDTACSKPRAVLAFKAGDEWR